MRLLGPDAQRLWVLDQQLAVLRLQREALVAALRLPAPSAGSRPMRPRSSTVGAQRLLLGLGVFCLAIGALVFVAVAWSLLGTLGQAAVMLTLTAAAFAAVPRLAGRDLPSTATALEVLGCLLIVADLWGAWQLGLVDDLGWRAWLYTAVSGVVAAAVLVPLGRWLPGARVSPAAAASSLLVAALALVSGPVAQVDATWRAVGAALVLVVALRLGFVRIGFGDASRVLLAGGLLLAASAVPPALEEAFAASRPRGAASGAGVLAVLGLVALSWAVVSASPRALLLVRGRRVPGDVLIAALVAGGTLGTAGAALLRFAPLSGLALAAAVAAVAVLDAVRDRSASAATIRPTNAPGSDLGSTIAAARLGVLATSTASAVSLAAALTDAGEAAAVATVLAVAVALRWFVDGWAPRLADLRQGLLFGGGLAAVAAGALLGEVDAAERDLLRGIGLTAAVAVCLAVAGWWRVRAGHAVELPPALAAVAAQGGALLSGAEVGPFALAAVAAAGGLMAVAYAVLPRRSVVAHAGAALFSLASWSLTSRGDVEVVEAYSLPAAALLALAGALVVWRSRAEGTRARTSSWVVVGPAVGVALGPSTLACLAEDGWVRPTLVLAAASVVLLLGIRMRASAAVVPAAVAVVVVGWAQLWPVVSVLPRWITLALVGALLVWWGARYERSRRTVGAAMGWLRTLH